MVEQCSDFKILFSIRKNIEIGGRYHSNSLTWTLVRKNYALIQQNISMSRFIENEGKLLKDKIMGNPQSRNESRLNKHSE